MKDPAHLVEVADGDGGKVNLLDGSRRVTDGDCWALLGKIVVFFKILFILKNSPNSILQRDSTHCTKQSRHWRTPAEK